MFPICGLNFSLIDVSHCGVFYVMKFWMCCKIQLTDKVCTTVGSCYTVQDRSQHYKKKLCSSPQIEKMKSSAILALFSLLLGISLATPSAERGALSRCDPAEDHACCYPAGEISIDNCDCDAGVLCEIYCENLGYATSWYSWG